MWTDKYIGLPFEPNGRTSRGVDCWGLIWLVYRNEFNIDLPKYDSVFPDESIESIRDAHNHIEKVNENSFRVVETPSERDVILLRIYGNLVSHVGLYIGSGMMLHIMSGINSVVEDVNSIRWKHRVVGYRRYDSYS